MKGAILRFQRPKPPADPAEAADWWFARRALGRLRPHDERALKRWLAEPLHAAHFEQAERLYAGAGLCAAEPEILRLRAEALRRRPPAVRGRRVAAGLIAALMVSAVAVQMKVDPGTQTPATSGAQALSVGNKHYETRVGEQRRILLDDGSLVSLNTGSLLEVSYNKKRRDVRLLRGQALFKVAHNTSWPFVVTVADREVTAVGTAFDVRLDGDKVSIVLVEGKVRVEPLRLKGLERLVPRLAEETLIVGERLVAIEGLPDVRVAATDVQRATSWTEGQVIFRDDALAAAVLELNRYSQTRLVVSDSRVAALKVSGVFNPGQPQNFVDAVTAFYPVDAERRSPGVVELVWRERG